MSEKKLFEIMGSVPSGEEITLYFSGLTLREAMGKLLRRYNYVLMQRPSKEPLLILMGRIERRVYTEKATPDAALHRPPPDNPAGNGCRASDAPPPHTAPPREWRRRDRRASAETGDRRPWTEGAALRRPRGLQRMAAASTAQKAAQRRRRA